MAEERKTEPERVNQPAPKRGGSRYRVFDAPNYDRPGGPTKQPNVRDDHYEPDRTPFGTPKPSAGEKKK